MQHFIGLFRSNKGATAIEYGLIAALIAIAAISAISNLGTKVRAPLNNAANKL